MRGVLLSLVSPSTPFPPPSAQVTGTEAGSRVDQAVLFQLKQPAGFQVRTAGRRRRPSVRLLGTFCSAGRPDTRTWRWSPSKACPLTCTHQVRQAPPPASVSVSSPLTRRFPSCRRLPGEQAAELRPEPFLLAAFGPRRSPPVHQRRRPGGRRPDGGGGAGGPESRGPLWEEDQLHLQVRK